MIRKFCLPLMCWMAFCYLLPTVGAWAQDSSDSGGQTPLGDVVRRQREQRLHSKIAKRVVSDGDIPANHMNWMNGQVAEFVIIPAIRISGLTPNGSSSTAVGQKKDKIYVGFGPHLGEIDWCGGGSLECAENTFLRRFQGGGWVASSARILFDSDSTAGGYPSRVAHFEILHDTRGKTQGSVALIQTPIATLTAYCMYNANDRAEAEPECNAFISSLRVEVPERYVYVQH